MKPNEKIALITGCSSGFGYLTALKFARNGWIVFAGVKDHDEGGKELSNIANKESLQLEVVKLDVTNDKEIKTAIESIHKKHKRIDLLINNAGFGYLGPVEDFEIDEVQKLYDVNIFGMLRMIKAVLPIMREQKLGRIINISSVNGLLSFGLYGVYSSSKFALETLSEALRFEVKPFGIDVTVVEPGSFLTKFSENSRRARRYLSKDTAYSKLNDPLDRNGKTSNLRQNKLIQWLINPQKVADKLFELGNTETTNIRYKIGVDTKLYTLVRKIVPDFIWEYLLHKAYKWN